MPLIFQKSLIPYLMGFPVTLTYSHLEYDPSSAHSIRPLLIAKTQTGNKCGFKHLFIGLPEMGEAKGMYRVLLTRCL